MVLYNSGSIRLSERAKRRGGDEAKGRLGEGAIARGGEGVNDDLVKPEDFQGRYHFHHTSDIIRAAQNGQLPDKIMITIHPQRWTNRPFLWGKELVLQNVKNVVKRLIYVR